MHRLALVKSKRGEYGNLARLVLFALTAIFYGIKQPWWLIPFGVCIGFDFLWATLLTRCTRSGTRKLICGFSVVQNLSLLSAFKYWDPIQRSLAAHFPEFPIPAHGLEMPPGISFYTFESLSFVIDVYRRHVTPPKNPLEFFAFIGMFPRFVAGPIVRYREMASQFVDYRGMQLGLGLFLFCIGLFYKSCFGDSFAVFTHYAFGHATAPTLPEAWLGSLAYTMQIYFDFAGYSLMAIGLGRCLGFVFPDNFRTPYLARDLQEFWRRWHISLSTWLRDYLYIPLGGNRNGTLKTYRNIFLTMLLGGIWHGAGLNFLVWGAWHGFFLCLERWFRFPLKNLSVFNARAVTFLTVLGGWVFFKASTFQEALRVLSALGNVRHLSWNTEALYTNPVAAGFCGLGLIYCFFVEKHVDLSQVSNWKNVPLRGQVAAAAAFCVAIVFGFSQLIVPFLYFQF
ncbi:MAG: MBOAT family protein [Bdellovibrionaceae bacterium]|nr:MBOAT family protein [Pseudobdellovibrionaceae bacterium]